MKILAKLADCACEESSYSATLSKISAFPVFRRIVRRNEINILLCVVWTSELFQNYFQGYIYCDELLRLLWI